MNQEDGRSPSLRSGSDQRPFGVEPASAVSSKAATPNAVIAPAPEPSRISAIARIATARCDALVGPPAWAASEVAARHGYLYGWYAALPVALEYAATIADQWRDENKAAASKARKSFSEGAYNMAEMLDGAAIECNAIAGELRKIASAAGAREGHDPSSGHGAQPARAAAESRDAQPQSTTR